MSQFVDECQLNVRGGDGGAGAVSFRREGPVAKGGPNGGDGGTGGDVWLVADHNVASLLAFRDHPHRRAGNGVHGKGKDMHGRGGDDEIVVVPEGTIVRDLYSGEVLAELWNHGDRWCAAAGGRGGRGNARFLTNQRRAPSFAEQGEHGEERWLKLELQLMADVALVGFPNVGKSTLISVISAAKPKIADYPFTTLEPNLGVVRVDDDTEFVVADIPGLIEGASEGKGLGHRFLRHVERARVLCLLVDLAAARRRAAGASRSACCSTSSATYRPELLARPRLVVGTKADLVADVDDFVTDETSGSSSRRSPATACAASSGRWRRRFTKRESRSAGVRASCCCARRRPARWSSGSASTSSASPAATSSASSPSTTSSTHEATAYISHRLDRLGVHKQLARAGAADGDVVWIGDFSFEYRE